MSYLITNDNEPFENNVDFIPDSITRNGIPIIKPEQYIDTTWIPFSDAGSRWYMREAFGIHFFISDCRFQRLWTGRDKYREMLTQYAAVMTPDFSLFTDWPLPVQKWNHYRKHLLGAWMQSLGCRVYPTIAWSDESSYTWCFDGEPYNATVCVSSVGSQNSKETRQLFLSGYNAMLEKLEPETIVFYGSIPDECKGNIVKIESFQDGLRRRLGR